MTDTNPRQNWLTALFVAINALFLAKYSMRLSPLWPVAVILYSLLLYSVIKFILPVLWHKSKTLTALVVKAGAVTGILLMLAAQLYIDPLSVNVDRWSALHYPISHLLDGRYPYSAPTHLGGRASPFPVWQLLHIPFYLCGNVGLSFFAALALFIFAIRRTYSAPAAWAALVLAAVSVTFYYEAAVRSDLLANMLLLASAILLVRPCLTQQWIERHYISVCIAVGLFASTRLITLLPVILLLFPYYLRLSPRRMILSPIIIIAVFAATFIPVILLDPHEFFFGQYPPWLLQTRQGSAVDFLIYIPLIIYFAMLARESFGRYCLLTALYLIIFVGVSFIHQMAASDNFDLFGQLYDITYFSASLPFIIIGCITSRNTKQ